MYVFETSKVNKKKNFGSKGKILLRIILFQNIIKTIILRKKNFSGVRVRMQVFFLRAPLVLGPINQKKIL